MKNNILVSIITPMYNCAEFAEELLNSMCAQTLKNIEIICVDDGSTDNTKQIISAFMKTDNRIKYFYEENSGAGAARNLGIMNANGEYVICIDADDQYEQNMMERLYTTAKEFDADMVFCALFDYKVHWGIKFDNGPLKVNTIPVYYPLKIDEYPQLLTNINLGPINKLYRRAFIENNKMQYTCTITCNDAYFALTGFMDANKVIYLPERLVTIRREINKSSISNSRKGKSGQCWELIHSLLNYADEKNLSGDVLDSLITRICMIISHDSSYSHYDEEFIRKLDSFFSRYPFNKMSALKLIKLLKINQQSLIKKLSDLEKSYNNETDEYKKHTFSDNLFLNRNTLYNNNKLYKIIMKRANLKERMIIFIRKIRKRI